MSEQLTLEQLAANCGYSMEGNKAKKGEPKLLVLVRNGRELRVDQELINDIATLCKPVQAPAGNERIKAVS